MSGTSILTVNGAYNGQTGLLSVPSALPQSVNTLLQGYLDGLAGSIGGGEASYVNYNAATGMSVNGASVLSSSNFIEQITNVDSVGGTTSGSVSGVVSVASGVTDLFVQYPGNITVAGVSTTDFVLLGSSSDVAYSVSGGAGSIFAAGGADSISVAGSDANYAVASSGNDTVVFNGTDGNDSVNAEGSATTRVFVGGSDAATVTASDSAQASVVFLSKAGGNLDFINNSSQAQTIYSGSYTTSGGEAIYAVNAVTAFGGTGGGFYVGGRGGFNYLDGGTGNSTLVGGGASDTLVAGGSNNMLFTGVGAETLIGGGVNNSYFVGLEDVGIGTVSAVGDLVSAGGSGQQSFVLGNLTAVTLTGSTVTGASNIYDVLGTYTTTGGQAETLGGSSFTITDFGSSDTILLTNGDYKFGSGAATVETVTSALGGAGSQILLSDGTVITLKGVSTSHVNAQVGGHTITYQ
ncbi:beta strand repeat-containing protein [Acidocella sp.]|uniref:beta strand repeat-containing protein n=1 Tax=Acidocella sp. TaxID=50710 RepID=UPI003D0257F1